MKNFAWGQRQRSLLFLIILLAATLPVILQIVWPFLNAFIVASVIAIMMHPVKERLERRLHRPGLATLLATLATVSLLGIVLAVAGFSITNKLSALYAQFNKRSLDEGGWPALVTASADRFIDAMAGRLPIDKEAVRAELIEGMKTISGYLISNIGIAFNEVTGFLFTGLLVSIFLYFLLRYGENMVTRLAAMTPLDSRTAGGIVRSIHDSVIANVNGMVAVAVGQGVLLILGFWIVGVNSPVLWGALGGLASIVPVAGSLLIWAPVAAGFLVMGVYWKAIVLTLWGVILVGSADNVLRSIVVGAREKQHPMIVALAAIGGTFAFGILGILLGPLMVSLAAAILKEVQRLAADAPESETEAVPGSGESAGNALLPPGGTGGPPGGGATRSGEKGADYGSLP